MLVAAGGGGTCVGGGFENAVGGVWNKGAAGID